MFVAITYSSCYLQVQRMDDEITSVSQKQISMQDALNKGKLSPDCLADKTKITPVLVPYLGSIWATHVAEEFSSYLSPNRSPKLSDNDITYFIFSYLALGFNERDCPLTPTALLFGYCPAARGSFLSHPRETRNALVNYGDMYTMRLRSSIFDPETTPYIKYRADYESFFAWGSEIRKSIDAIMKVCSSP